MTRDPAELADAFLDGDLPASGWEAARAADPAGCERALAAARAQRAALAGLPRPALPAALRQQILAAATPAPAAPPAPIMAVRPWSPEASRPWSPEASRPWSPEASRPWSPEARRPWWRYALPAALAAGLALAVWLPTRSESAPSAPPAVAQQDRLGNAEADVVEARRERASQVAPTSTPAAVSPPPLSDQAPAVQAKKAGPSIATAADAPAPPATPSTPAAAADEGVAAAPLTTSTAAVADADPASATETSAPSPIVLQLAWRSPARRDLKETQATSADDAKRSDGLARSPAGAPAQATEAPAEAPVAGDQAASAPDAVAIAEPADRELQITLRNQTISDLRIVAGGIRLVGVGSDGRAVWRTILRSGTDTVIPAGRSLGWVQPITVLPPGIDRLRLEVDGQRSTEIEP